MKKKSVSELIGERNTMFAKREQINIRMNEISDKVQAENRPMSEAEKREYDTLQSDFAKLGRELSLNADMVSSLKNSSSEVKSQEALLREVLAEAAKKAGMLVCCAHVEGMSRRTDANDQASIDGILAIADVVLVIEDSDSDGFFTNYCNTNNLPLLKVAVALNSAEVME